jgi:hypothetical protein
MRTAWVLACLLVATPAGADDYADAAKKLLDAQVAAINAGDPKAFAATFTDDALLILPLAADEASGAAEIQSAAKHSKVELLSAHFSVATR